MARAPILHTASGKTLNVTWINRSTQKAERVIHMYEYSKKGDSIFKAYNKPSSRKIEAFNEILKEMQSVNGYGMKITGAGSDVFSCAYRVKDGAGYTFLVYHTPVNRFCIDLGDDYD